MTKTSIERPILFYGEMVRAILEGRKTQTRRVIKLRDFRPCTNVPRSDWYFRAKNGIWSDVSNARLIDRYCPYGKSGDRLWVRETWAEAIDEGGGHNFIRYKADGATQKNGYELGFLSQTWKPSIFMPRWASRITLEITNVRAERVQSISEMDCVAEGTERVRSFHLYGATGQQRTDIVQFEYKIIWDKINAKRGYSWKSNPWVWVIEFKIVRDKDDKDND